MSIEGDGGGVPQDGHALDLFHGKPVDRALDAVDQDEDAPFAGGLGAADVEGGTSVFLTLETGVLKGGKSGQFAIQGVGETDGGRVAQFLGGDGIGRRRGQEFRLFDAIAQIHLPGLLVTQDSLSAGGHRNGTEPQQAVYKYIA